MGKHASPQQGNQTPHADKERTSTVKKLCSTPLLAGRVKERRLETLAIRTVVVGEVVCMASSWGLGFASLVEES